MKKIKIIILLGLMAIPATVILTAGSESKSLQVARGKYLVNFGGCNDCHTPVKITKLGPVPDFSRMLSGHPEHLHLPPPELKPGPWFVVTAGMTAWAGPWGISYAANLTPDQNTGLGIWTEDVFLKAMKTGRHMGSGRQIQPPMPWQSLSQLPDRDLRAIYAYLRTIPAVVNHVPERVSPAGTRFE